MLLGFSAASVLHPELVVQPGLVRMARVGAHAARHPFQAHRGLHSCDGALASDRRIRSLPTACHAVTEVG
jgi:hypothetical protein